MSVGGLARGGYAPDMFGYTDEELERIRARRRALRGWVVVSELLVFGLVLASFVVVDVFHRPGGLAPWVNKLMPAAAFRLDFDDVELLTLGRWRDPSSWRLAVTNFQFRPKDPTKTSWKANRIVASLPNLPLLQSKRVLHIDHAVVSGLEITAYQQRPPPPWTPKKSGLAWIQADRLEVWGASFSAPEDPPLLPAFTHHIYGALEKIRYDPTSREVSAVGALTIPEFTTGAITISNAVMPTFELRRSDLHFTGSFEFGTSSGKLTGQVLQFHKKSDVTLTVDIVDGELDKIVETATGSRSPIAGTLSARFSVHTGGELPRGGAWMEGFARFTDGRIALDRRMTKPLIVDILRIMPWVKVNANYDVLLSDMRGTIRLSRGNAQLKELVYKAGKRDLTLRGHVTADDLALIVRLVPLKEPETRAGLGMVLYGTPKEYQFRLAEKSDLLPLVYPPSPPSDDEPAGPTRKERRQQKREARAAGPTGEVEISEPPPSP